MSNGNRNGGFKVTVGILILLVVGGLGFVSIKAVNSASDAEVEAVETRVTVIESNQQLILYKLDEIRDLIEKQNEE